MTNRLTRAISRALSPRPDEVHVHLDADGKPQHVCEDARCPNLRSRVALEAAPVGTLHHRGLRR